MIRKLFIIKLKDELREKIIQDFNIKSINLDEEELTRIKTIVNKENISIDDINDLLIDYLPYICDNDKLIELIKDEEFINSVDEYVVYFIYKYLIDYLSNKDINLIMKTLGYKYKFSDVDTIDSYITTKSFCNNDNVFEKIDRLYKIEEKDSLFKERLSSLVKFKKLALSDVYPYDLVSSFYPIKKVKNLYYQLCNVEKLYKSIKNEEDKKDMLIIYYTYNYKIDPVLEGYFDEVNLELEDIVNFIRRCEDKDVILNEKQIDNLFQSFKKRYYVKNGLVNEYKKLCNKVIAEYSDYYDTHYYFSAEEFIKYYNNKHQDNFNMFLFGNGEEVKLNSNILSSLFTRSTLLENYYLVYPFVNECKTFKSINKKRVQSDKEEREFVSKRKKFYRKNKCKINMFLKTEDECIKYFMLKNVDECDRNEFMELFKIICGDNYKEIGFSASKIRMSAGKLKEDFLSDLFSISYRNRNFVLDKYKGYIKYVGVENYIKSNYFEFVMEEYDRQFNIILAKDILYRFSLADDDRDFVRIYENVLSYVKNHLLISDIDVIFNKLAKRKYADLISRYDMFKSKYFIKKDVFRTSKKKECKVIKKIY